MINSKAKCYAFEKIQDGTIDALIEECRRRNISLIIPSSNSDASILSMYAARFVENNIDVVVSENYFIDLCIDKLKFSQYFGAKSNSILESALNLSEIDSTRIVAKERFGAGSIGVALNLVKSEISLAELKLKNPIFQQFLDGQEFSADVWVKRNGDIHAIALRERQVIQNGESVQCEFFENLSITSEIHKILKNEKIKGPLNIQGFVDTSGSFKFIEINPRFGGAFLMSRFAGFSVADWIYEEYLSRKPISDFKYITEKMKVVRISNYVEF